MKYFKQILLISLIGVVASVGCGKKPTEQKATLIEQISNQNERNTSPTGYPDGKPLRKEVPEVKPVFLKPGPDQELQSVIAEARETLTDAKARFINGFPPGHILFVTTRLSDDSNNTEQVFIRVTSWEQARVCGKLSSTPLLVKGYRIGQYITVAETQIIDWTISLPDGSEEGNVVGKYLDKRNLK